MYNKYLKLYRLARKYSNPKRRKNKSATRDDMLMIFFILLITGTIYIIAR